MVDHVAEGNTHRATAARFKVLVKFVNDMGKLKAATGGLAPKPQGNGGGHGKQAALKDWIARRIGEKRDLTAAALAAEIETTHGVAVRRGSVWSLLRDLGLTHKKRPARGREPESHCMALSRQQCVAPRCKPSDASWGASA